MKIEDLLNWIWQEALVSFPLLSLNLPFLQLLTTLKPQSFKPAPDHFPPTKNCVANSSHKGICVNFVFFWQMQVTEENLCFLAVTSETVPILERQIWESDVTLSPILKKNKNKDVLLIVPFLPWCNMSVSGCRIGFNPPQAPIQAPEAASPQGLQPATHPPTLTASGSAAGRYKTLPPNFTLHSYHCCV